MRKDKIIFAIVLIVIGTIAFLSNFFNISLPEINWNYIWPIILIFWGVSILFRKEK